jgi:hypothetical protein
MADGGENFIEFDSWLTEYNLGIWSNSCVDSQETWGLRWDDDHLCH